MKKNFTVEEKIEISRKIWDAICRDHGGKMRGMESLSTSCMSNPYCLMRMQNGDLICAWCFSANQQSFQHSLRKKLEENFHILTETEIPIECFPELNVRVFRLQSFGETYNITELGNYFRFCEKNPDVTFALWMKNVFLLPLAREVHGMKKPTNLILIQSSSKINEEEEIKDAWIDKVFTVYDKKYLKAHPEIEINCGGNHCLSCLRCYKHGGDVYIREQLKGGKVNWNKIKQLVNVDGIIGAFKKLFKKAN